MATKYRLVPEKTLLLLIENSLRLNALESGGVDNWTWYGDSFNSFLSRYNPGLDFDDDNFMDFTAIAEQEVKGYTSCQM